MSSRSKIQNIGKLFKAKIKGPIARSLFCLDVKNPNTSNFLFSAMMKNAWLALRKKNLRQLKLNQEICLLIAFEITRSQSLAKLLTCQSWETWQSTIVDSCWFGGNSLWTLHWFALYLIVGQILHMKTQNTHFTLRSAGGVFQVSWSRLFSQVGCLGQADEDFEHGI